MGLALTLVQGFVKHATAKGLTANDIHWLSRQQDADVDRALGEMGESIADILQKAKARIGKIFRITRGGDRATEQVVGATSHSFVNENINSENFPLTIGPKEERELVAFQLLEYDHEPTTEEVLAELKKRGLERSTYEDALKWDESHPDEKGVFVFLHEPWRHPDGYPSVLYAYRDDTIRGLNLGCSGNAWGRYDWFFGVRPRKF